MSDDAPLSWNHWAIGIGLVVAGFVFAGILGAALGGFVDGLVGLGGLLLGALFFVGVTQLLWVVPLAVWAGVTKRTRTLWGILGTAGLVFILNAACFGLMAKPG